MEGLAEIYAGPVARDAPLAKLTSFQLGGPADWLFTPRDHAELGALLGFLAERGVAVTVLGGGSNVLIRDGGVRGAVIRISREFGKLKWLGDRAICGAGLLSAVLAQRALTVGRGGFSWAAALPGNLGGALRGNAGAFGGEMSDHFAGLRGLRLDGSEVELGSGDVEFEYRSSDIPQDVIVTEIAMLLPLQDEEDLEESEALHRRVLAARHETQPRGRWTAGCTFKNPEELPAGQLIDECGLKGLRVGGASISELHANFIVVEPGARAADVEALLHRVRDEVERERGVLMETEIRIYGEA